MKLAGVLGVVMLLAGSPLVRGQEDVVVFTMSADDMAGIETSSDELKEMAHAEDAECRQYPTAARMFAGCAARNVYMDILEFRGICNTGPFVQDENWGACPATNGAAENTADDTAD